VEGNRVYRVAEVDEARAFYVCLDPAVRDAALDALPLDRETVFVCLDSALSDSKKLNLDMQCLLKVV
jgi:hypothetical protein